jgi:hypothetical protein
VVGLLFFRGAGGGPIGSVVVVALGVVTMIGVLIGPPKAGGGGVLVDTTGNVLVLLSDITGMEVVFSVGREKAGFKGRVIEFLFESFVLSSSAKGLGIIIDLRFVAGDSS